MKTKPLFKTQEHQTAKPHPQKCAKGCRKSWLLALPLVGILLADKADAQTTNSLVADPTTTYAGKTYSQWAAAWWQYLMSLPTTNNPLVYDPDYPVVPLSTGQSGPVWFIGGGKNILGIRTFEFTNEIPGSVALFLQMESLEFDNADCPNPDTNTAPELFANISPTEDGITNLTCTIDGFEVAGLSDVMTTPYRVQAYFDFTCPAFHNYVYDFEQLSCYQNDQGAPYSVTGAVTDGVFLMIRPLSAGSHVIRFSEWHQTYGFIADVTHYLTVEPVTLSIATNNEPGSLALNWPQTPDRYTLERSPTLSSTAWQPATNLPVVLKQGVYRVTAPAGGISQFFRLRLN